MSELAMRSALAIGSIAALFPLYLRSGLGAGDIKYLAAVMLFVAPTIQAVHSDPPNIGITGLIFFALHRLAGRVGVIRTTFPEWQSWKEEGFYPYGPAISVALVLRHFQAAA